MSTGYELRGRTAQKQRTRSALIVATRGLLAAGVAPTVEAAADAADISRTTAYRYFPNQRSLIAAAHPTTSTTSLLPSDASSDPEERLVIVLDGYLTAVFDDEAQQRTTLRLSLDPSVSSDALPLRQGRVIGWLTEALEPARDELGDDGLRRLVLGIRSATGIEALVWLVDVAGLSRHEAMQQMRWTGLALWRSAIAEARRTNDA
jgi:AcrR family transcriptional regulator